MESPNRPDCLRLLISAGPILPTPDIYTYFAFFGHSLVLLLINSRIKKPNIPTDSQNPMKRYAKSSTSGDCTDSLHQVSTVASMKFARPQPTFMCGLDSLPNGVRNILPATPNKK